MHRRPSPELLVAAYCQGAFPMADERGELHWYDPDPRAIIPLDRFHLPRRLARTLRRAPFELRFDSAFREVMTGCAGPGPGRERTWISQDLIAAYETLHRLGLAHSVETWDAGELVGGIYGVSLGGLFAGESMFSRRRDASKVALAHLVRRLREGGYVLFDVQFLTPHLARFGAVEIGRREYKQRLANALPVATRFLDSGLGGQPCD